MNVPRTLRVLRWLAPLLLILGAGIWLWRQQQPEPLPPDLRGRMIFVSDRDGYDALYERRLPGNVETRLTILPEPARQPALAPDGARVAFVMGGRIAVLTLATDALEVLTLGVDRRDAAPSWSPDGQSLAIASRRSGESNADIHLLSLAPLAPNSGPQAEARRTLLTSTAGFDESEPVFSPDGTSVVFVREDNLVRLQLASLKVRRLTGGFRKVRHPRIAPSGRLIYLWSQEKQFGLDSMDLEGKERETLWTGSTSYSALAPSPDGRYLLASFAFDLRFHWRDVLKLRATEELRLLDARGTPVGVVTRSLRYSNRSPQWGS